MVRYEATLVARRLVPLRTGEAPPAVPRLSFVEQFMHLASSPTLDYRATAFQAWVDNNDLRRKDDEEDDVAFARRVFRSFLSIYTYRDGVKIAPASTLCDLAELDCDTGSLVYAGALRSGGVPTRIVSGWPLRPIRPTPENPLEGHAQVEFFADGVGWVPVDVAKALAERQADPLTYFGLDKGDLLIAQVDPDYMVTHPDGRTERIDSMHPGPSVWGKGHAGVRPDVTIRPLGWEVAVEPAP